MPMIPRLSANFVGSRLYLRRRENPPSPTSVQSLEVRAFRVEPCGSPNLTNAPARFPGEVKCVSFQGFPASRGVAKQHGVMRGCFTSAAGS